MYFCGTCLQKHEANALFSSHHVVNMEERNASEVLFCKQHKEHPVRYFCKPCSLMLCTICTMEHNPEHNTEPLEKGIIEKYRRDLLDSLRAIKSRLSEVNSRTKYLETIKDAQQKCMYSTQRAIKERTEAIVAEIRKKEKDLLAEVQRKIEQRMRETGIESLTEIKFHSNEMQSLCSEIQTVVQGSPQQCLVAYDDLIARLRSLPEAPAVSTHRPVDVKTNVFCFVPGESDDVDVSRLIGTLHDCSLDNNAAASTSQNSPTDAEMTSPSTSHRRATSILSAISSSRKHESKRHRLKSVSASAPPKAARGKINADDLLRRSAAAAKPKLPRVSATSTQPSTSSDVTLPQSPSSPTRMLASNYKLVFKIDQVGGWPGKVTSPSSVTTCERLIVVAECENRLQMFDTSGISIRVIGWGKTKPQRVAALPDGRLAITDRIDNCVKVFSAEGELVSSWGAGMFSAPTGLAVMSNGNYVVTDTENRCTASVHGPDGSLLTSFGSWGSGDAQFQKPSYVAVDRSSDDIFVSDAGSRSVKVFDSSGNFLRSIPAATCKTTQLRHPMGVAIMRCGDVIVADRDSHRLVRMTSEGVFKQEVLTKVDGLKYPVDVALLGDNQVVVVEAHSGFLSKDQHHAVKLFKLIET